MNEIKKKEALVQMERTIQNRDISQIDLVVCDSYNEESAVSLKNVLRNMKALRCKYLWLMLLLTMMGISIALLFYQLKRPTIQVSSVVTLKYIVEDDGQENEGDKEEKKVADLSAPDGTELDLAQITSSYVLDNALRELSLSRPITVESLRNNLEIQKIITKETRQQQELISEMMQGGDDEAFGKAGEFEFFYQNSFLIHLRNGFSDEQTGKSVYLTQEELQILLERVISSYDVYLFNTYADLQLPGDEISIIDYKSLDIIDSLDQLSSVVDKLYDYCDKKPDVMKTYRSWRTGRTLEDLMASLRMIQDVDINYLRAYVEFEYATPNAEALLSKYRYQLRQKKIEIDKLEKEIATINDILNSYENDSILVSSQDGTINQASGITTEYYNELVMAQAENYEQCAEMKASYEILSNRILKLQEEVRLGDISQEVMNQEAKVFNDVEMLYQIINDQMLEINQMPFYRVFLDHTAAQEKSESYLKTGGKNIMIGATVGIAIVFLWWFMAALIPEIVNENEKRKKKELTM